MPRGKQFLTSGKDLLETLGGCCERGAAAMVSSPVTGVARNGVFTHATANSVGVALAEAQPGDFPPGSLCLVAFGADRGASVFFAKVRFGEDAGPARAVELDTPAQIFTTDARSVFRIPTLGDHGVQVVASDSVGGPQFHVEPLDLSLAGIRIQFAEGTDPGWALEQQVQVELKREGARVALRAEIRHHSARDRAYGLVFPDVATPEGPEPPPALKELVMGVQRHWLRTRTR